MEENEKTKSTGVSFTPVLQAMVVEEAQRRGISMSALVIVAIREELARAYMRRLDPNSDSDAVDTESTDPKKTALAALKAPYPMRKAR